MNCEREQGVGYMGKVEGRKGKGENDVMKFKKMGNRYINRIKHKKEHIK